MMQISVSALIITSPSNTSRWLMKRRITRLCHQESGA